MKKNIYMIGKWSFIVGLIIAILAAFISIVSDTILLLMLFILGLLVGFLNVTRKNSTMFLLGVITLLLLGAGSLGALSIFGFLGDYLQSALGNFIAFVGAAGLVVSLKAIFETGR